MIENEVSILRRVKHPNIILLVEELDSVDELYLVMEFVKVRSLNHILYFLSFLITFVSISS